MRKSSSITFKIGLLVTISIIMSVLILSTVYFFVSKQRAQNEILSNSVTFAEVNSQPIYQDYLVSTSSRFTSLLFNRMSKNQDITQISMIGYDGRIYFDSNELKVGDTSQVSEFVDIASLGNSFKFIEDSETLKMVKSETTTYRPITINNQMFEEIIIPIKETENTHIVSMRYLVSYDSLNQKIRDIYLQTLIVLPIGLIFIIISVLVSNSITKPLNKLFLAFEEVKNGNYGVFLETKGNDEISQLSDTFNKMVQKIKDNLIKQQEYQHTLENDVNNRTEELAQKVNELESLNKIMVNREIKMIELKKEIDQLKKDKK